MRRAAASVLVTLGLLSASLAWWSFAASFTILDPGRSGRIADVLVEQPVIRDAVAQGLSSALQQALPDGSPVSAAEIDAAAHKALDDPRALQALRTAIVDSHQRLIGDYDGPVHLDVDVEEGVGRGPARQMGEQVGVDAGLHARPQGEERCPVDQGTLGQVDAGIAAPLAVATLQVDAQLVFLDRPAQEANAAQHEEAVVDRARFTAPAGVATDAHGSSCTPVCRGRTGAPESFLGETGDLCHSRCAWAGPGLGRSPCQRPRSV